MRDTGLVVASTLLACASVGLVVSGWRQPRPRLSRVLLHLHRTGATTSPAGSASSAGSATPTERLGGALVNTALGTRAAAWGRPLRLIGRSVPDHLGRMAVAALLGLVVPSATVALLHLVGVVSLSFVVPVVASIGGAVLLPLAVHGDAMARSADVRRDLRHQLTAFLDMVTMLLAGNTGHEGALQQAARAGDGKLFHELRRRMREMGTTGNSLIGALSLVGDEFGVVELEDVANAARLSAAEGAPVARTLAAKCASLRSTLAADEEAAARIRNDKVTPPLVGMALLFMALIIYPALAFQ